MISRNLLFIQLTMLYCASPYINQLKILYTNVTGVALTQTLNQQDKNENPKWGNRVTFIVNAFIEMCAP